MSDIAQGETSLESPNDIIMGDLDRILSERFGITAKITCMDNRILAETIDEGCTTFIQFKNAFDDIFKNTFDGNILEDQLMIIAILLYTRCYLIDLGLRPVEIEFNCANAFTILYLMIKYLCLQALINNWVIDNDKMAFFDSSHNIKILFNDKTIIVCPNLVRTEDSKYLVCILVSIEANIITIKMCITQVETITSTNISSDLVMDYYQHVVSEKGIDSIIGEEKGHIIFQSAISDETVEAIYKTARAVSDKMEDA